jgi:hypothetical protein
MYRSLLLTAAVAALSASVVDAQLRSVDQVIYGMD